VQYLHSRVVLCALPENLALLTCSLVEYGGKNSMVRRGDYALMKIHRCGSQSYILFHKNNIPKCFAWWRHLEGHRRICLHSIPYDIKICFFIFKSAAGCSVSSQETLLKGRVTCAGVGKFLLFSHLPFGANDQRNIMYVCRMCVCILCVYVFMYEIIFLQHCYLYRCYEN
jgi:hypothetical protein